MTVSRNAETTADILSLKGPLSDWDNDSLRVFCDQLHGAAIYCIGLRDDDAAYFNWLSESVRHFRLHRKDNDHQGNRHDHAVPGRPETRQSTTTGRR